MTSVGQRWGLISLIHSFLPGFSCVWVIDLLDNKSVYCLDVCTEFVPNLMTDNGHNDSKKKDKENKISTALVQLHCKTFAFID